jgi:type VI secretion system protein ImpH
MPDLIERLQKRSYEFDFFQAVSLLEEYYDKRGTDRNPLSSGRVQFAADTATAFPPSDIASVQVDKNGVVRFLLYFMGLLGVSSPLPQYFTEYATRHEGEETALSDFLAIFNHRFYVLFYRAWKKYRLFSTTAERDAFGLFQKMALLAGLDETRQKKWRKIVSYAGIFAVSCRSAEGLKTVIADYFDSIPVAIQQWVPRWAPVHDLKKMGVDAVLGLNAMAGTHIRDTGGKFRITLGPLEKDTFETFLPDSQNVTILKEMVTLYCTDSLDYDIVVKLKPAALIPVVLGEERARLGISTSCGKSSETSDAYAIVIGN